MKSCKLEMDLISNSKNTVVVFFFLWKRIRNDPHILPRTRNANPFGFNKAISGLIKLVSGLNLSLGSYSFVEISTMALGEVLQIEKFII